MNEALRARLTGRAARWVQLLRDYGHLDDNVLQALFVEVSDELGGEREQLVDLPDVKRITATLLFDRGAEGEDGADVLAEDWPFLFF